MPELHSRGGEDEICPRTYTVACRHSRSHCDTGTLSYVPAQVPGNADATDRFDHGGLCG